jgi:hypothetical protein
VAAISGEDRVGKSETDGDGVLERRRTDVGEELLDRQDGIDQVGGTGDPPDLPSRGGERLAR